MNMDAKSQTAFMAALVATDQLSANERRRHADLQRSNAKQSRRGDRYEGWMRATAAFHMAMAACELACLARVHNHEDATERNADELAAVIAFIAYADEFMRLPLINRDDHKERGVLLRKWAKCSRTAATAPLYSVAAKQWADYLADIKPVQEGC
jgi:hypothetical protein